MEMLLKTTLLVFGLLLAVLHSQASTTVPLSQLNQADNEGVIDIDETHDNLQILCRKQCSAYLNNSQSNLTQATHMRLSTKLVTLGADWLDECFIVIRCKHDISSDGSGDSDNDEEEEEEEEGSGNSNDESTGSGIIDQAEVTTVIDASKIKILTKCEKHHKRNLKHSEEYVPQCTNMGEYKKVQCMENVCWCVSPDGKQIPGTKWNDTKPDCKKGSNLSPCLWNLVKNSRELLGTFRPNCTKSGEYEQIQCHGSKCWCSDEHGAEIKGSRVPIPINPVCDVVKANEVVTLKNGKNKNVLLTTLPTTTTTKAFKVKEILPKKPETEPKLSTPRISISSVSTSSSEISSVPSDGQIHEPKPNESATEEPGIMAAIIAGAVVGLFVCILLTMFIVYRMRKKDEGSYPLDEPTKSNYSYTKAPDKEFYA